VPSSGTGGFLFPFSAPRGMGGNRAVYLIFALVF